MTTTHYAPDLSHCGVSCFDIDRMADFYCKVLGLQVTDKGMGQTIPVPLIFLSSQPEQHHQLAFSKNRPAGSSSTVMQLSFRVRTLDDLREARKRALANGATKLINISHGNAISIYFLDPEENLVEVHIDTPWYVAQPHGRPFDLDRSDDEIWAAIEKEARAETTFKRVNDWESEFAGKLAKRV